MTLRRSFPLSSAARTASLLSILAAATVGIASTNTERVVTKSFAVALEQAPVERIAGTSNAPVSGSEAYWLAAKQRTDGSGAALEPAAWAPLVSGLSTGDRITMSGGKSERVLEVVAIAKVENAASGSQATNHVAVTCRDLSAAGRPLTTFVVPAGSTLGVSKTDRAL